jgi:uncharacterized protein YqgC (DUF456 family)
VIDAAVQSAGTVAGVDLPTVVALALLAAGVVGSVVPFLPGGPLSLGGVYLYWWSTGYDEPGLLVLSGLTLLGLLAVAVDWLAGAVSAKAGGASTRTTVLATAVGFVGIFVAGPLGFLAGTAGTVLVLEYGEGGDLEGSVRAAGVTLLGMLTSNLLQVLLTGGMFAILLWIAL